MADTAGMGYGWRINRHARQTRNELRKQTKLMQQQATYAQTAWPPPSTTPQGWYPDPSGQAALRWWNGYAWTSHTHTGADTSV